MKVGCYDCGATDKKLVERPRTTIRGWKDTVNVCKECLAKWLDKHPMIYTDKEKEMLKVLLTDEDDKIIRP